MYSGRYHRAAPTLYPADVAERGHVVCYHRGMNVGERVRVSLHNACPVRYCHSDALDGLVGTVSRIWEVDSSVDDLLVEAGIAKLVEQGPPATERVKRMRAAYILYHLIDVAFDDPDALPAPQPGLPEQRLPYGMFAGDELIPVID